MLAAVNGKSTIRRGTRGLRSGCLRIALTVWVGWAALSHAQEDVPKAVPTSDEVVDKAKVESDNEPKGESEEDSAEAKTQPRMGLIVEAKVAGAKVFTSIPGAKQTVLAAARETKYGVKSFSDDEWREKAYDLKEFYAAAERTADAVVAAMEPEFQRDSRDVIDYALITSRDGFLSSALTSKRFLARFEREFGDDLRVVAVDRYTLHVFPAIGGKLEEFGPALAEIYRTTPFPGSLEVFQVNDEGYRVVGSLAGE